jgi:lipid A 3-O-deacylase
MTRVNLKHLLIAFLLITYPVVSVSQDPGYISIISENDIYVPKGQDRHYTNGLRLSFGLENDKVNPWYRFIDRFSTKSDLSEIRSYEFAIGHNIYTPEFFLLPDLQTNDRPYAGWIYGELSTTVNRPGVEDGIAINFGIIGPAALGEEIQKLNHSIIGDPKPQGWRFQLRNEPAILIKFRRSWFTPLFETEEIKTDLITRTGINLGNVFTDASAGIALRIGNYLPERELPLRIQPGLSGNKAMTPIRKDMFDWMLFAEIQGRGVAQNIFLDGNTFTNSHSVSKRNFVWDAGGGIILGFGHFKYPVFVSFSFVLRDREFTFQQGRDNFGSALIGVQY